MPQFSLEEARALLPQVVALTERAFAEVQSLADTAHTYEPEDPKRQALADTAQKVVERWAKSITELGAEVKGLWLVDFDSGDGYYCWKYPEPSLEYFHSYETGFGGRTLIAPDVLH